jgi:hypothetical protein
MNLASLPSPPPGVVHYSNPAPQAINTIYGPFELRRHDAPQGFCQSEADRRASRIAISHKINDAFIKGMENLLDGKPVDMTELATLKAVKGRIACGDFDALPIAPSLELIKRYVAFVEVGKTRATNIRQV